MGECEADGVSDRADHQLCFGISVLGVQDFEAIGRAMAARHAASADGDADTPDFDPDEALANYSERARVGDWSMRAALTRFSLPQPVRASEVLQLVRRLDAALHPFGRALAGHAVACDRGLTPATVADPPIEPYIDTRTADLARLGQADPAGFDAMLDAYLEASNTTLDEAEQGALPLLRIAVHLDALAEALTAWANRGRHNPPIEEVDATCAVVRGLLDDAGVPQEQGPPPGSRSRG